MSRYRAHRSSIHAGCIGALASLALVGGSPPASATVVCGDVVRCRHGRGQRDPRQRRARQPTRGDRRRPRQHAQSNRRQSGAGQRSRPPRPAPGLRRQPLGGQRFRHRRTRRLHPLSAVPPAATGALSRHDLRTGIARPDRHRAALARLGACSSKTFCARSEDPPSSVSWSYWPALVVLLRPRAAARSSAAVGRGKTDPPDG